MLRIERGKYRTQLASTKTELTACQALRMRAFQGKPGRDSDQFDPHCLHVMIIEADLGRLVGTFRLREFNGGQDIAQSYSAQFYDLSRLEPFIGNIVEMGRFCVDPAINDPEILRVAWGAITRYVDDSNVAMLFGCSSFAGTDPHAYADTFALLALKHPAPDQWRPIPKANANFPFSQITTKPDLKTAMKFMPPLLRSYLVIGGWVSDHAVIDHDLNTLHVFTALEIAAIPPARKRLLRTDAR